MTIANLVTTGIGPGSSIAGLILGGLEGAGAAGGVSRTGLGAGSAITLMPDRPLIVRSKPTIWADPASGVADNTPIAFAWTTRGKLATNKIYIASTAATLPSYNATGLNGLPTIEFDTDEYLRNSSDWVTGYSGRVVAVAKTTNAVAEQVIYSQSDFAAADQYLQLGISADNKIWYKFDNGSTVGVVELTGNTVLGTDFHVLEWACDDYAISMWVDGVAQTNTVVSGADNGYWFSDVTDTDFSVIGARRTGAYGGFLDGSIAYLLVYSPDKTASVATRIWTWLKTKFGL